MKLVILSILIMGICLFNIASSAQSAAEIATLDATQAFGNKLTLLFAALTGQHNVFAQFGLTVPIAANLRSLEAGTDSLLYTILQQPCLSDANVGSFTTSTTLAQDALNKANSLTSASSPSDVQSAAQVINSDLITIVNNEEQIVNNSPQVPCSPAAASSTTNAYNQEKTDIDTAINGVITLYEQFCIPSPLYPSVNPICVAP